MQTIVHDTTVVTADEACTVQYDAALVVADDRIAAIGQPGPFEIDPALAEQGLTRIEALHTCWHSQENGRIGVGLAAWAPDTVHLNG